MRVLAEICSRSQIKLEVPFHSFPFRILRSVWTSFQTGLNAVQSDRKIGEKSCRSRHHRCVQPRATADEEQVSFVVPRANTVSSQAACKR